MALAESIFHATFKKNFIVAVFPGALQIGEVEVNDAGGIFKETKSFCLPQQKLCEFSNLIEELAKNIALCPPKKCQIELSNSENIVLEDKSIQKVLDNSEAFRLQFDEFIFIDFLTALSNVVLLICLPSKRQLDAMKRIARTDTADQTLEIEKIFKDLALERFGKMILEEFLNCNNNVIQFYCQISKLIGKIKCN